MHGHYLYEPKHSNALFVVRDGRDVLISWYYHCYFDHGHNRRLSNRIKSMLPFDDYEDIQSNLPEFIRFHFERKQPLGIDWLSFNELWVKNARYIIHYEKMLADPVVEIEQALKATLGLEKIDLVKLKTITDKYAFSNQVKKEESKKTKGRFLRKGVAGGWINSFFDELLSILDNYAEGLSIKLDYESNNG